LLLVGGGPVAPVAVALGCGTQPPHPRIGLVGADLQEPLPLQGVRQLPGILVRGLDRQLAELLDSLGVEAGSRMLQIGRVSRRRTSPAIR
jgi:hypothetical protein